MKYYLFYVYGDCRRGDRNANGEEFDTQKEAIDRAIELSDEHVDLWWSLIYGEEVARGYQ